MGKLHEAAAVGDPREIKKCLRWWRFTNINARDHFWKTPLHVAAAAGKSDTVRLLLEYGADANMKDRFGRTPLHEAAESGNAETVGLLLAHGANVHARCKGGYTPLHMGVSRFEVVKILLEHGADAGSKDDLGVTPIASAQDPAIRGLLEDAVGHSAV